MIWIDCNLVLLQLANTTFAASVDPGNPESERKVSDMHTGLWMQRAQAIVGGKKTAIGVVLYSDKTHALQGMQCYPVYSELFCIELGYIFEILDCC